MTQASRKPSVQAVRTHPSENKAQENPIHAQRERNRAPKRWTPYRAWKTHHQQSAKDSVRQIIGTPVQALFNALIIGIALALPAALFSIVGQLQAMSGHWQKQSEISVFVQKSLAPALLDQLKLTVARDPGVHQVDVISPEAGLAALGEKAGAGDVVAFLKQNPLPPVLAVRPQLGLDAAALTELKARLEKMPHVDEVLLDMEWIQKLNALLGLGQQLFWSLAVTFGLAVILVVGNTLRLAIERRREEIQVLKLVGGTEAFIRRPFLYAGAGYGALGGLAAVLILWGASAHMAPHLMAFESAFNLTLEWQLLTFGDAFFLLVDGLILGLMGSWLAVSRYLKAIEPQ